MPEDHTAQNRATYDRIADRYADNLRRSGATRPFAELERRFLAAVPARGRLADLGCGPGRDAAYLAATGLDVVGIDLSAAMLALAARALAPTGTGGSRVAQADLRRLPLREGAVDAVWCAASLLHVPDADTPLVLDEMRRVVRRGGWLALVTAIGHGTREEPVPYAPDETRWFVYREPDRLVEQLGSAGLPVCFSAEVPGNRRWLTLLAQAD